MSVVRIGPYTLPNRLIPAPMAGATDRLFRQPCHCLGIGVVVSEMATSDVRLWNSRKSRLRLIHDGEDEPRLVQIAGDDPAMLAEAMQRSVELDAQIIDINMDYPAEKVCNKAAGLALLRGEALVVEILDAAARAVNVPVTLKIRTGRDRDNRNGVSTARFAEQVGIQALAVHDRTRADPYTGEVEYETIAAIKQAALIPMFTNGDIDSPEKVRKAVEQTGVGALLIGRTAQGGPWTFRETDYYLRTDEHLPAVPLLEV